MNRKEIEIVYEDEWLIVVEKPSGLLTMSTGKAGEVTAYSILTDYVRECAEKDGRRPAGNHGKGNSMGKRRDDGRGRVFIVHRIDRETSGLLVFAKDEDTKLALQENWDEAVLERKYIAVLEGHIEDEEGWIETLIRENPKSMKMHCAGLDTPHSARDGWQPAASHCKTLKRGSIDGKPYTCVEFELETGRKNQIRAHSEWIGHPIAGDRKYGAQANPFGRLALHAKTLSFIHPWTGKVMKFSSALPRCFKRI